MSRPTPFLWMRVSVVALLAGALACGGDSSGPDDPEPEPVTVTVQLTMTGEDLDPDGYTLALGSASREVGAAGSTGFTGVVPGTYDLVVSGLSPNCSVDGGATRQVTVTAATQVTLTVTCVSVIASGLFTEVACPLLTPAAAGGIPMAALALGALPTQLEAPLYARVTGTGGDQYALGFVDRATDGTASMRMPLDPSGSLNGGAVTVRIAGGVYACATPVALQLGALPAAPGETAAVVDLLEQFIALQAGLLGTSAAALRAADPGSVPEALWPLYIATTMVDHPQNPNSLRAILQGTAPLAAGGSLETSDRLLAWSGLRAALEASLPPVPSPVLRASTANFDAVDCLVSEISLPSQLHDCMTIANNAAFKMDGMSGQVQDDIVTVLGYAANVPYPPAKLAAAIMGAAVFIADKLQEGTAMLLPRSFVDLKADAAPLRFMEDEDGTGDWEAEVRATSAGWALDKAVLDALSQLASLTGAYADWLKRFADPDVMAGLQGMVTNAAVNEATGTTAGSDIVTIAPKVFGPVDVSDAQWSERSLIPDDVLQLTGHTSYVPKKAGQTQLVVRTKSGMFGGQQVTGNPPLDLEVEEIRIQLEHGGEAKPVVVATDTKRNFDFTIRITGSKHPDQIVLDPPFPLNGSASITPGNPATLHYQAPADLTQLPDVLVVRHTATTGARATSTEPRTATVEIRQAQIVVTPGAICLAPGATQQFSAAVVGLDNDDVAWDASQGPITAGGVYTAPGGLPLGTEVTITATSTEDEDVMGTATVTVGCVCSFSVTVGGTTYDGQPGDRAVYLFDQFNNNGIISVSLHAQATDRQILFALGGIPVTPGTYPVDNVGGNLAYTGQYGYGLFGDDEVTFWLQEYAPHTALVGAFSGTLRDNFEGKDGPPLAVDVIFRVYPPPDGGGFFSRECVVPPPP